ncbi:MAG TPA: YiiX/YebB-like N1pC/P60 family cysteine hydrolase [Polyangiaceae bacterium]|nr:YiiX/YebB-like N1pC/P60 family cysteine hydrolase [Polyangiaceae bacterium]
MAILALGRRQVVVGGAALVASSAAGVWFWPSSNDQAAYPFARRVGGKLDPLWNLSPEKLLEATSNDAERLGRLLPLLDGATRRLETLEPRLANAKTGELSGDEREQLREAWFQVFEPILAVDELKSRYAGWYGLDYSKHSRLHARGFALSFAALCGQVDAGLRLLGALEKKPLLPVLFDEAMPQLGLPARTFSGLRHHLGRARDLLLVPLGNEWYERWIFAHLTLDQALTPLLKVLDPLRRSALARVLTPTSTGVENKLDVVKGVLFERWFPLQKNLATWAGDTRVAEPDRRLISDAQLTELKRKLEPGDIILERRNWYLSNVGLPGFWPHAALYVGTQAQVLQALAGEPTVKDAYGDLGARFAQRYPKAWASLAEKDHGGHEHCVIEAVSEGVSSASVEHSCAADYVAALRPRVSPLMRARAIERALMYWGRPYDFNFDFATDDQVVCSELVVKAYEPSPDLPGLSVPYVELVGRRAVAPTEIAKHFRDHLGKPEQQLDFVYFLEGREAQRDAVVANAEALATTCDRPKWDIVQP